MIIAVTGRICAGETSVCKVLEKKGFKRLSLSDMLREELRKQGKKVVRENLDVIGDKLRSEKGKAFLAMLALKKAREGDWAFDSIYVPEEAELLRSKGAYIVGVVAPVVVRYERARKRGEKFPSLEAFVTRDDYDARWGIDKIVEGADFIISNDGTLEDLEGSIDLVLETISSFSQN